MHPPISDRSERRADPVDLHWRIEKLNRPQGVGLRHQLWSPSGALAIGTIDAKTEPSSEDVWERESREIFQDLDDLLWRKAKAQEVPDRRIADELKVIGDRLWLSFLPEKIRQTFDRSFEQHETGSQSLFIESNESWIPWELTVPGRSHDHLCCHFRTGRWLFQEKGPRSWFQLSSLLGILAGTVPTLEPLPFVREEEELLRSWLQQAPELRGDIRLDPTLAEVLHDLEKVDFDWLHFAGHATFDNHSPNKSALLLKDHELRAEQLGPAIRSKLRLHRPLVFLNACQAGRQGRSLTGLGGWPSRFVRFGQCGALICPQWAVRDSQANRLSKAIYRRLQEGTLLGEAVRASRQELLASQVDDLSPLAFVLFGHPNARVSFGHEIGRERKDAQQPAGRPVKSGREGSFHAFSRICEEIDNQILRPIRDHSHISSREIHTTYRLLLNAHLDREENRAKRLLLDLEHPAYLQQLATTIHEPALEVVVGDDLRAIEFRTGNVSLEIQSPDLLFDCNCRYREEHGAARQACKIHGTEEGKVIGPLFSKGLVLIHFRNVEALWRQSPALWPPSIDTLHFADVLDGLTREETLHGSVLDIGSGTGFLGLYAASRMPAVTGIAFSDWLMTPILFSCVNFARSRLFQRIEHQALLGLDFAWGPEAGSAADFDLIVCNPPYLPLPKQFQDLGLESTVAGTELLERLISIAETGSSRILVAFSELALPEAEHAARKAGVRLKPVGDRRVTPFRVPPALKRSDYLSFLQRERGLKHREGAYHPFWHRLGVYEVEA